MPTEMLIDADSFWQISSVEGVQENPLGYYCPACGSDPSYSAAHSIENFIAYGFTRCWLSPDNFDNWHLMQRGDVQWLREYFLQALEFIVTAVYTGVQTPGKPQEQDWAGFDSLTIGEDSNFTWIPERVDSDSIMLVLNTTWGDDTTIWLSLDAIRDMRRVRAAIAVARQINGKGTNGEGYWVSNAWKKIGVPKARFNTAEIADYTGWYRKKFGSDMPKRLQWIAPTV